MPQAPSPVLELVHSTRAEIEQAQRELREVKMMLDQSQAEVVKLTQRNAASAAALRQMQVNLEATPRADIKAAYDAAQDSQQRLFTMRGQLEKLQSDQTNKEKLVDQLTQMLAALESAGVSGPANGGGEGKPMIVRIVEAQEAERQRLSRQIHDGPAQALSNFILQSEIAMRLFEVDPERARAELMALKTSASSTFQKIRDFIFDLRPMMLDDLGLMPTVKRYVDTFKEKSGIQATFAATGAEKRFENAREIMVFRGVQELLGNVRNHASASQVKVTMDMDESRVRVTVEDNGKGFDPAAVFGATQHKTIGLPTLKERMELLGGQLEIDAQPGQGTRAAMECPLGEGLG